jgi:hypothetical protein
MKDSMFGRKLDHLYCVSRMDYFEKCAYDLINEDAGLGKPTSSNSSSVVDGFIGTCVAVDMIVREYLYFPK